MKKIHFYLGSLLLLFLATSAIDKQKEPAGLFEKIIWVELDASGQDSVLFKPYSKAWQEMWRILDPTIHFEETPVMNYESYKRAFENRSDNLFTTLHPLIVGGSIQLYSPYQPESFGLGALDDGELRYPVKGEHANKTFLTSDEMRNKFAYYLGMFGAQADYPLVDEFGEPMMVLDTISGMQMYVYPPRDYMWYEDADLIKYKLRVSVFYDKKGVEKKRIIRSIAPVVNEIRDGQIEGEKVLFWLNFNDLSDILKKSYYFDETGKPVTYLKHIQQKVVNSVL